MIEKGSAVKVKEGSEVFNLFRPTNSANALKASIDPFEFNEFSVPIRKRGFVSPEKRLKEVMNKLRQEKIEQGQDEEEEAPVIVPKIENLASLRQLREQGMEKLFKFNLKKRKSCDKTSDFDLPNEDDAPTQIEAIIPCNPPKSRQMIAVQDSGWLITPRRKFSS